MIYTTMPPSKSSDFAKSLFEKNLCACINITPVKSFYRYKGDLCEDEEHLLIIKTKKSICQDLIHALKAIHPYSVPEIIVQPATADNPPYLPWLQKDT